MEYSYPALALIALSGMVSAQPNPVNHIPECARTCIANAVAACTTCRPSDDWCKCQPSNFGAIVNASTACVEKSCTEPKGPTPQGMYLPPSKFSADMVEEVLDDAQYHCFMVI